MYSSAVRLLFVAIISALIFSGCRTGGGGLGGGEMNVSTPKDLSPVEADLLNQLFANSGDAPGWPAMPRLWSTVAKETFGEAKLSLGLQAEFLGVEAGTRHEMSFEMGRRTTLVMITTRTSDTQTLTYRDSETDAVRFNKVEGSNFVVLCLYTAFLQTTQKQIATIRALGSGVETNGGLRSIINRTAYSQFLPVDVVKTPSYYLNDVCDGYFKESVKPAVLEDLKNLAEDILIYSNPADKCLPPDGGIHKANEGDPSCKDWHRTLLPGVEAWTYPRCEPDQKGNHRCILRSRKGGSCPKFIDDDGKLYSRVPRGIEVSRSTSGLFEYYCDPYSNLKCTTTQEPWRVIGIQLRSAKAKCQ